MSGLAVSLFLYEMRRQDRLEALREGLVAYVQSYYDEFTDSDAIDENTLGALRTAYEVLFSYGGGDMVDAAIRRAEDKINAWGGQESSTDGRKHYVRTVSAYEGVKV